MRISYYEFPETMAIREVALATKRILEGRDDITEVPADVSDEALERNFSYTVDTTVTMVKKLMRMFGGCGYTLHIDRDGSVFETTPIHLKGNNSRFKYNRHL